MHRPCYLTLVSVLFASFVVGPALYPAQAEQVKPAPRAAVSGRVVDEQGNPVAGVVVHGRSYTDKTEGVTDASGEFVLNVIESPAQRLSIVADDAEHDRMGVYRISRELRITDQAPVEITLTPSRRFDVAVVDAAGKPASGATVGALVDYTPIASVTTDDAGEGVLRVPSEGELQVLYAVAAGEGFDYRTVKTVRDGAHRAPWLDEPTIRFQLATPQTVRIKLLDRENAPIANVPLYLWLLNKPGEPDSFNISFTPDLYRSTTDESGVAEFRGVPDWNVHPLTFWPTTDEYVRQRITFDPKEHAKGELMVTLERLVPVTGHVKMPDGSPAGDVGVSAVGDGYDMDGHRGVAKSDANGQFTLNVAPNQLYMFLAGNDQLISEALDGIIVRPDQPVTGLKFQLRSATRIHGRVTVGDAKEPVAAQQITLTQ